MRVFEAGRAVALGLAGVFLASGCARVSEAPITPPGAVAGWEWAPPGPPAPVMAWVPAGPFRKGSRTPEDIVAIVIHTTEGRFNEERTHEENQARNFSGVINYFRGNDRNVSAHYVIGPKGEICQMVNETDVAHTQTYYNGRAIGIECAGWSRRPETWTPEMLDSLVELCAYLCVKWEVSPYHPEGTAYEGEYSMFLDEDTRRFTGAGLIGHFQVQPWNKTDPGPHFPWEDFSERVRARIVEFGAEPLPLPTAEEVKQSEVAASASVPKEGIRVGEPFVYTLLVRGPGAEGIVEGDITLPDFDAVPQITMVGGPRLAESGAGFARWEVTLQASEAGTFGLTASRIRLGRAWHDTGTLRVVVAD